MLLCSFQSADDTKHFKHSTSFKWALLQRFFVLFAPNVLCICCCCCSYDFNHTNINTVSLLLGEKPFSIDGWWCTVLNSMRRLSARKNSPYLTRSRCPSHSVCWTGPLVSQIGNLGLRIHTYTASHLPINRRQPAALHKQAYWINVKKHSGPTAR